MNAATTQRQPDARTRLLDTAMQVIRAKGYTASTVDDICEAAGLTKGAFFHHFKSKEDLAVAAAAHFSQMAERLFGDASYRQLADPLGSPARLYRFPHDDPRRTSPTVHLPPRHHGAGGLRHPPRDPPRL